MHLPACTCLSLCASLSSDCIATPSHRPSHACLILIHIRNAEYGSSKALHILLMQLHVRLFGAAVDVGVASCARSLADFCADTDSTDRQPAAQRGLRAILRLLVCGTDNEQQIRHRNLVKDKLTNAVQVASDVLMKGRCPSFIGPTQSLLSVVNDNPSALKREQCLRHLCLASTKTGVDKEFTYDQRFPPSVHTLIFLQILSHRRLIRRRERY